MPATLRCACTNYDRDSILTDDRDRRTTAPGMRHLGVHRIQLHLQDATHEATTHTCLATSNNLHQQPCSKELYAAKKSSPAAKKSSPAAKKSSPAYVAGVHHRRTRRATQVACRCPSSCVPRGASSLDALCLMGCTSRTQAHPIEMPGGDYKWRCAVRDSTLSSSRHASPPRALSVPTQAPSASNPLPGPGTSRGG